MAARSKKRPSGPLRGIRVLVAGAGLAGLAAARDLESLGATTIVVEARDRVGGRVWTWREGFHAGQHAEAGADLIDSTQKALISLARDLDLRIARILKGGFGYYGVDERGRVRPQSMEAGFGSIWQALGASIRAHNLAERRWDSAIARELARKSVAGWLKDVGASAQLTSRFRGFRGLFLADPEELSLLAIVDFFSEVEGSGWGTQHRLVGGNDQLATEMARRLQCEVRLRTVLRRIRADEHRVVATVEHASTAGEISADYMVLAIPASTLRDVVVEANVPDRQRDAITRLRYGHATRLVLQFERRFWRATGRPAAFGSDQPTGAVWDGNEEQKGPAAILSFLAGGGASAALQSILQTEGPVGVARRVEWLGKPAHVLASRSVSWEDDPWARGGYAFFDSGFDPELRDWLARPAGRIVFAGEHTSIRWQGYMNGAVESGQRAAAEVAAMETSNFKLRTSNVEVRSQ
jgi:monoamine oxidase